MADVILQMRSMRSVVPPNRYAGRELFCEPSDDEDTLYCECCSDVYDDCPCEHEWDDYCDSEDDE